MIIPLNLPILPPYLSRPVGTGGEGRNIFNDLSILIIYVFAISISTLANQHIGFCALFVPDESLAVIFLLRKP
jgi:hypothetical protein